MRDDESDRRLIEYVVGASRDEQVGRLHFVIGLLANRKCTYVEVADTARQLDAPVDIHGLAIARQPDST